LYNKKCERIWVSKNFDENNDRVPLVIFDAGIFGKDQVKFRELQTGATAIL
jgi:hypothetical protein